MEEALRLKLRSVAALTALVGNRIDWGLRTPGAPLPALSLFQISGVPQSNLAGPSGWTRSRVQIDCVGRTYKIARDVADLIAKPKVGALDCLRETVGDVRLRTFIMNRRVDEDSDADGALYCNAVDVMVWSAAA